MKSYDICTVLFLCQHFHSMILDHQSRSQAQCWLTYSYPTLHQESSDGAWSSSHWTPSSAGNLGNGQWLTESSNHFQSVISFSPSSCHSVSQSGSHLIQSLILSFSQSFGQTCQTYFFHRMNDFIILRISSLPKTSIKKTPCRAKSQMFARRTLGLILVYNHSKHRSPWAVHSAVKPLSKWELIASRHWERRLRGSCLTAVVFLLMKRSSKGLPPSSKIWPIGAATAAGAVSRLAGTAGARSDEELLGARRWWVCCGVGTMCGCKGKGPLGPLGPSWSSSSKPGRATRSQAAVHQKHEWTLTDSEHWTNRHGTLLFWHLAPIAAFGYVCIYKKIKIHIYIYLT